MHLAGLGCARLDLQGIRGWGGAVVWLLAYGCFRPTAVASFTSPDPGLLKGLNKSQNKEDDDDGGQGDDGFRCKRPDPDLDDTKVNLAAIEDGRKWT